MRPWHCLQVLCSRLLAIEYIDLAEQSLQALEKLSHEHPQVLPSCSCTMPRNAIIACLNYACNSLPSAAGLR